MNHFRNWKPFLLSLSLALALLLGNSSAVLAQTTACTGALGAVTVVNLEVSQDATCTLDGTIVQGDVLLRSGATLDAAGVQVGGDIETDPNAAAVDLSGDSTVGGSVRVLSSGVATLRSVTITGSLELDRNDGAILVEGSTIGGNLQANENTGGVSLVDNVITGDLACTANNPVPTGSGNQVSGTASGQCAELGGGDGEPLPFSVFLPVAMN